MINNAEDFLLNDFVNMSSIMNVVDVVKKYKISDAKIEEITKLATVIKENNYMNAKNRAKLKFVEQETDLDEHNAKLVDLKLLLLWTK